MWIVVCNRMSHLVLVTSLEVSHSTILLPGRFRPFDPLMTSSLMPLPRCFSLFNIIAPSARLSARLSTSTEVVWQCYLRSDDELIYVCERSYTHCYTGTRFQPLIVIQGLKAGPCVAMSV